MRPSIRIAQRACEAAKARQAVVVWFDEHGQFAVASYGETVAECSAAKPVCNAIADMFDSGYLQPPGDERAETLSDRRRGELGGWNEYDRLRNERDTAVLRADRFSVGRARSTWSASAPPLGPSGARNHQTRGARPRVCVRESGGPRPADSKGMTKLEREARVQYLEQRQRANEARAEDAKEDKRLEGTTTGAK